MALLGRLRMTWKIVVPYALLAVVLAAFGGYFVTRLVTGSLEERFTNQLVESSRVAADSVVRQERRQLAAVRSIIYSEGVGELVTDGSAEVLHDVLVPITANAGAEIVAVLDAAGAPVLAFSLQAGQERALTIEADATAWPLVARVRQSAADELGDKHAAIIDLGTGPGLFSAAPIPNADGASAGVVLVGTDLRSLALGIKTDSLADVALYDGDGRLLATSLAFDERDARDSKLLVPGDLRVGQRDEIMLAGREYDLIYSELRVRQAPVGWVATILPSSFIASSASTARTQVSLLFLGATVAILLVGLGLARLITEPLLRLVRVSSALTEGDFTARSGIGTADEIGVLAHTFDYMAERLQRQHISTLGALVSAVDARDSYTRGHSVRVGHLALELGRALELPATELQHLQVGGFLHDIGKIGIRDGVLLKPDALSPREREIISDHPRIGLTILESVDLPDEVREAVGGHHERLDGSGYPKGLKGEAVGLFPRIVAVADVFDALITDRPYRDALALSDVLRMLEEEAERGLLDRDVVVAMRLISIRWEDRRRKDRSLEGFSLVGSRGEVPLVFRRLAS